LFALLVEIVNFARRSGVLGPVGRELDLTAARKFAIDHPAQGILLIRSQLR